jgi:ubiquinone/menaquinone biosynthesis C-methylase UbiE
MISSTLPEMYERWLVAPLFRPWAEILLDRVQLAGDDRLLDIACGTGIAARLAKERRGERGRVVGIDLNAQMLAVARRVAPEIEWREGSADALPVPEDERFDVVVCQQGLQFFPDKPAAVREMRRVLAPNGRLGASTWRPLDEAPVFHALHRVAERHLGHIVDQRHGFGDAAALAALLAGGGFRDVRVETMSRRIHLDDWSMFVRLNAMALVGMSAAGKEMGDEERARSVATIATESAGVLPSFTKGQDLVFDIGANVATAVA